MKLESVGEVIATRELDIADSRAKVIVGIGAPKKFPDSSDYYCPYEIRGLGNDKIRYAGGIDGIQALLLALQMVGAELYTSEEGKAGTLIWVGQHDLGFPVPDSISDMIPGSG